MKLGRFVLLAAVAMTFCAAPVIRAHADDEQETREISSAKKKKKKKKAAAKKHHAAKPKKHHKSSAGGGSHYPTQPGGSGFADIPNEKKDDLPPPQTGEPK